ncbi:MULTISPECIES: hypothetical protein [unclassified Micromonospora]|uniref:hypothetical protein n=1 Tax=unclassified Micromonospora TaxID=2617518 RepID=UPI00362E1225
MVFANYAGTHGGWRFAGHSAVHGPDGRPLAAAGLAVADLDDAVLRRQRERQRMLLDRAAPASAPAPIVVVP